MHAGPSPTTSYRRLVGLRVLGDEIAPPWAYTWSVLSYRSPELTMFGLPSSI